MPRQPLQDRGSASYAYTNIPSLRQYDMSPSPHHEGTAPRRDGGDYAKQGSLTAIAPNTHCLYCPHSNILQYPVSFLVFFVLP